MKILRLLYSTIKTVLFLAILTLGMVFVYPLLPIGKDFEIYTVQSGSMEPEISTGSVILVKSFEEYSLGDVITRKAGPTSEATVTHRIVEKEEEAGELRFRTKGDANEEADSETFSQEDIIGKVLTGVPYLGYPINFIKTPHGFILAVVIPATILIYEELLKIKRELVAKVSTLKGRKRGGKVATPTETLNEENYSITSIEDNLVSYKDDKHTDAKRKI